MSSSSYALFQKIMAYWLNISIKFDRSERGEMQVSRLKTHEWRIWSEKWSECQTLSWAQLFATFLQKWKEHNIDESSRGNSVTVSFCPCISIPEDPRTECLHHRSPKHGYHRQICSLCDEPSPARRICDRRPNRCSQKRRWIQWSNWTCSSPALQFYNPTGTRGGNCANPRLEPRSKPLRSPLERCIWNTWRIFWKKWYYSNYELMRFEKLKIAMYCKIVRS